MFEEEKKLLIELKVLRVKLSEITRLSEIALESSNVSDLKKLEEKKHIVEQRIKNIEDSIYPDVIA